MEKSKLKNIKPSTTQRDNISFVTPGREQEESDITFSFKLFNGKSIRVDNFNNYYENQNAAHKSVSDLLYIFNNISRENTKTIFLKNKKSQFHLNQMSNDDSIEIIEKILLDGYGLPKQVVAEFDREYFEIVANADGGRLIFVMVDNLMLPLFLDPNHFVYRKVSKNKKRKTNYSHPGFFVYSQEYVDYYNQLKQVDSLRDAAIQYARNGEFRTVNDFLKAWDEAGSK